MQFDHPFPAESLPPPGEMGSLAANEEESLVYKLDLASGNTFQKQAKLLGDLWSMGDIASTTGHIYSLFTSANELAATSSSLGPGQASEPERDMAVLCVKLKDILTMAAKYLVTPETYVSSEARAVVMIAYHTLIINLLFPGPGTHPPPDVLETLAASANALDTIANSDHSIGGGPGRFASISYDPFTANSLALGIDACGRAFKAVSELGILLPRRREFIDLARKLLAVLKSDRMAIARQTREAKKALKVVIAELEDDLCVSPPDQLEYGHLASGDIISSGQSGGQQYVSSRGGGVAEAPYPIFQDPFAPLWLPLGEEYQQEYPTFFPSPAAQHQPLPGMPFVYPAHSLSGWEFGDSRAG
jgi:hypothetical protein